MRGGLRVFRVARRSAERPGVPNGWRRGARSPTWSPDGRAIAFVRDGDAHVAYLDGRPSRRLAHPRSRDIDLVSWSPRGDRLVFSASRDRPYRSDLYLVRPDGTGTHNLIRSPGRLEIDPAWSPDGSQIAHHDNSSIWVMRADGTGRRRIVSGDSVADPDPSFS